MLKNNNLDNFFKVALTAIVVLLAANLFKSNLVADAQAQNAGGVQVVPINGFSVSGLQQAISLGDGKTFVVYTSDKFMVYQLQRP